MSRKTKRLPRVIQVIATRQPQKFEPHEWESLYTNGGPFLLLMVPRRKRRWTERGFEIYREFEDLYGNTVIVQESSLATQSALWVFVRGKKVEEGGMGKENTAAMHLTPEQAWNLSDSLREWSLEHGYTPEAYKIGAPRDQAA